MLNYLLKGRHYCSGDDIHNKTGNLRINVIRRRVRVIIVAMEKREIIHILSVYL
jgi:hypothetical protein